MARPISNETLEARWYDVFAAWSHADRETALKVLQTVHRTLTPKTLEQTNGVSAQPTQIRLTESA